MAEFDEDRVFGAPRAKVETHAIGQSLDALSAPELTERIEALRQEIARLERALVDREATRRAASAAFKS